MRITVIIKNAKISVASKEYASEELAIVILATRVLAAQSNAINT
jgi:hypothetical protein